MPVIMAVTMIRLGLTAIGFLMRSLLAQTEATAQIAVIRGTLFITDAGGRLVHSVPARSNMGFDR
jgi:IMP dehydrogenase/GMP reductase